MSKKRKPSAPESRSTPPTTPAAPTGAARGFSFFEHSWSQVALLLAAVLVTYSGVLNNDFVAFDDDKSIWYNPHIKTPTFKGIFGEQLVGMYVPVTSLAYTLIYQIFGEKAGAFHAMGLLVHGINVVLVFFLMRRIQQRNWAAFFVALMFGLHPMLAEPVSWVSALSTLMFSCFYLVTLHLYLNYLDGRGRSFYWMALLSFVLAGFSKSAAATLPLMLVALDWWRTGRFTVATIANKWPFWLTSLGLVVLTFITRTAEGHDIGGASAFSPIDRIFMVSHTLFFYPIKLLFPLNYSILYPFVKTDGMWRLDYYLALPALGLLLWWVWKRSAGYRETVFAMAMYALPLSLMLPLISVGTAEMRNDRYAYLPSLGIFFLLMLAAERIRPSAIRYSMLLAIAALFSYQAMQQSKVWKDGTALFKNCVDRTPDAALCQCNLAYSELLARQFDASIEHYTKALDLDKTYVEAYNGRGQAYLSLDAPKFNEALGDFTKAIEAGIVTPKLFFNRGKCLAILSKYQDALPDFSKSIELEPKSFETWYFRAFCREKTGDPAGALQDYSKAIALQPAYVEALVNRGLLYYNAQKYPESIADNSKALQSAAKNMQPMILVNRANAYLQSGQLEQALADANKALEISPNYPRAFQSRAAIYMKMGQADKAQADMQHLK